MAIETLCPCGSKLNSWAKYYCSRFCYFNFREPWNKGKYKETVSYRAIHKWIERTLGRPKKCLHCGTTEKLNWANVSGEYKRDLTDWMELCSSCHRKHDILNPAKIRLERPDRWLGRERPKRSTKRAN